MMLRDVCFKGSPSGPSRLEQTERYRQSKLKGRRKQESFLDEVASSPWIWHVPVSPSSDPSPLATKPLRAEIEPCAAFDSCCDDEILGF